MILKIASAIILLLATALCVRFYKLGKQSQSMTPSLGLKDGQLKPCPNKPNCVSSYAQTEQHAMQAVSVEQNPITKLTELLKSKKMNIVSQESNYVYATESSSLFGFVDDIEFYFDEAASKLHFRSASRVGHSDMGVNRKRVSKILTQLR